MVAIGEGARARVEQAFASMGTNVLIVSSGAKTSGGAKAGAGSLPTLTWDDLRAIQTDVGGVRFAAPRVHTTAQVVAEDRNWSTDHHRDHARVLRDPQLAGAPRRACCRPKTSTPAPRSSCSARPSSTNLFGASADPIGQTVRIANVPFQVVGVAAEQGPVRRRQRLRRRRLRARDDVSGEDPGQPAEVHPGDDPGRGHVRRRHRRGRASGSPRCCAIATASRIGGEDDFAIKNLTETASRKQESSEALTLLLASIAAVSLLVGGIGIMNIMLVSVSERTREIGVRMAVGAKPRHVRLQFLAEALALALAGGFIGVAGRRGDGRAGWRPASTGRC